MKKELNDKKIKENLLIINKAEIDELEKNAGEHEFSSDFNIKMKSIFASINEENENSKNEPKQKVLKFNIKKRVAIILVISVLVTSMLSIEASRKYLFNMFYKIYDDRTEIHLENNGEIDENYEFTFEEPSYLPRGFKRSKKIIDDEFVSLTYTNDLKQRINYRKLLIRGSSVLGLDTEKTEIKTCSIEGVEVKYICTETMYVFYWFDDCNKYVLSSTVKNYTELEKVIKSIIKNNKKK